MRPWKVWVIGVAIVGLGVLVQARTALAPATETTADSEEQSPRRRPGGETSVPVERPLTFLRPAANLDDEQTSRFHAGKALATQPWVRAPATTDARDGLGPLHHADTCVACHVKGGRGRTSQEDGVAPVATLVRISLPGRDEYDRPIPEPVYGDQLQPKSTSLAHLLSDRAGADVHEETVAEASVELRWRTSQFEYPDGVTVALRTPEVLVSQLGYGQIDAAASLTLRHAPSLVGVGLVDRIPVAELEARADPDDRDEDGISGRLNRVWDPEVQERRAGRFGWKAHQPSLRTQIAAAFVADMGITSRLFPNQPCTQAQARCLAEPHGEDASGVEISEDLLELVVFFNASLGVPERRKPHDPLVLQGGEVFQRLGCAACHTPHLRTGLDPDAPHLSEQDVWPYTDTMLHDLGAGLADGSEARAQDSPADTRGPATTSEWRTAPLWGIGLALAVDASVGFLHDGRARTVEEAILWHGGEAASSRGEFVRASVEERRALVAFVRSL